MKNALRVLLVDEYLDDGELVESSLRRELQPLELRSVDSLEALEDALSGSRFDLVLTEHGPRLDGLEVLRRIRARGLDTPTVLLTSRGSEELAVAAMKRGMDDYIPKRAQSLERLGSTVRQLLERSSRKPEAGATASHTEEVYQELYDNAPDMYFTLGPDGTIRAVNRYGAESLGYRKEELIGQPVTVLVHPEDRTSVQAQIEDVFRLRLSRSELEFRSIRRDGSVLHVSESARLVTNREGSHRELRIMCRDITDRRRAEEELQKEQQKALVTLDSIGDAVITTDADGILEYMNPVAEELTGWSLDKARGRPLESVFWVINDQTRERVASPVTRCLEQGRVVGSSGHSVLISRSLREYAIHDSAAPIRDPEGGILGVVLVFKDVTEARHLAQQVAHQATHDALTGLVNRREFERRLERALASAREHHSQHALCYLDLDDFKVVNDTVGHIAGDQMLRQVAALLLGRIRQRDTLARLGGDEFSLLLENCPLEKAIEVAESLQLALQEFTFAWGERAFRTGVSIGLVPITADSESTTQLLSQCDVACYTAKDIGGNRVYVYRDDGNHTGARQDEILRANELAGFLESEHLRLFGQPIVPLSAGKGQNVRYEILLRLLDGERTSVLPGRFIPAAERYGLMIKIDRWVLHNALRLYVERLGRSGGIGLAINLSGSSLGDSSLLEFVRQQFTEFAVPPDRVCFEITESAAITHLGQAGQLITDLKQNGFRFALDDFGSGLSSFSYLKNLPVDYVKIDGAFVKDMKEDRIGQAMVAAINEVGHVMGIETVAEWVESESLVEPLRELGVDYAQGYALGRPRPLEEFG